MKLLEVMQNLYRSEINSGMSCFWDDGWKVFLGDDGDNSNGIKWSNYYDNEKLHQAAEDLHDAAMEHFPNSGYAQQNKG